MGVGGVDEGEGKVTTTVDDHQGVRGRPLPDVELHHGMIFELLQDAMSIHTFPVMLEGEGLLHHEGETQCLPAQGLRIDEDTGMMIHHHQDDDDLGRADRRHHLEEGLVKMDLAGP